MFFKKQSIFETGCQKVKNKSIMKNKICEKNNKITVKKFLKY